MKSLVGKVTSTKMSGTVAVTVDTFKAHPVYKKRLRRSKRYLATTAEGVKVGDLVTIHETRPVSRSVHFKVEYVLSRAEVLTDVKHATKDIEVSPESVESLPAKAHAEEQQEDTKNNQVNKRAHELDSQENKEIKEDKKTRAAKKKMTEQSKGEVEE